MTANICIDIYVRRSLCGKACRWTAESNLLWYFASEDEKRKTFYSLSLEIFHGIPRSWWEDEDLSNESEQSARTVLSINFRNRASLHRFGLVHWIEKPWLQFDWVIDSSSLFSSQCSGRYEWENLHKRIRSLENALCCRCKKVELLCQPLKMNNMTS